MLHYRAKDDTSLCHDCIGAGRLNRGRLYATNGIYARSRHALTTYPCGLCATNGIYARSHHGFPTHPCRSYIYQGSPNTQEKGADQDD